MERIQYLIDTNVAIDYLGKKLPVAGMNLMNHIVNNLPTVSVITKIEVLGFKAPDPYDQMFTNFIQDVIVLNLTDDVVLTSINIRRSNKTKLPDAIIAATALVHGLTLLTRNTADFKNIPDLLLVDPHKL